VLNAAVQAEEVMQSERGARRTLRIQLRHHLRHGHSHVGHLAGRKEKERDIQVIRPGLATPSMG
jgi:hypothetical protein